VAVFVFVFVRRVRLFVPREPLAIIEYFFWIFGRRLKCRDLRRQGDRFFACAARRQFLVDTVKCAADCLLQSRVGLAASLLEDIGHPFGVGL
jgi:hypothetical protein